MFSIHAWEASFTNSAMEDTLLLIVAVCLVTVYTCIVLGSCSPVHFRAVSAGLGIMCVFLATASGYSISFFFGLKISRLHNIMPFMVLGIGVDDMFVIVNTID